MPNLQVLEISHGHLKQLKEVTLYLNDVLPIDLLCNLIANEVQIEALTLSKCKFSPHMIHLM